MGSVMTLISDVLCQRCKDSTECECKDEASSVIFIHIIYGTSSPLQKSIVPSSNAYTPKGPQILATWLKLWL
jgi:hypothetical protein